jgi:hypothetical protein
LTIEFPTELLVDEINLRDFTEWGWDLKEHWKLRAKKIFGS